jgi:hypothetical protein
MDRIRTGLTGLAAVFLVTAAASLLFGPDDSGQPAALEQEKAPGEPLAQLGVAPSNEKSDEEAAPAAPGNAPAPVAGQPPASPASAPGGAQAELPGAAAPGGTVSI